MRRAIPFLAAAAALATAGCTSRTCDPAVLNVYWETFTDASGRPFNCSDPGSGVAGIQVLVNGRPQFSAPIPCVPFSNGTEGVGLVDFAPGSYLIDVQAFDASGRLRYEDQKTAVIAGNTCNLQQTVDTFPVATTGTLTMSVTFNGASTCAAAGVQNFFVELVDDQGLAVPVSANGFLPCLDTVGTLPFFQVADLDFGRTYTFRTLAATVFDPSAPPTNQRVLFQRCGDPVAFSALTPSFVVDLPVAVPGQVCP